MIKRYIWNHCGCELNVQQKEIDEISEIVKTQLMTDLGNQTKLDSQAREIFELRAMLKREQDELLSLRDQLDQAKLFKSLEQIKVEAIEEFMTYAMAKYEQ